MPDNSATAETDKSPKRLIRGRQPELLKPTIPYRIDVWGHGRKVANPGFWKSQPTGSAPQAIYARGRPKLGIIVPYFGDETKAVPHDPGVPVRTLEEGFVRNREELNARVEALGGRWSRDYFRTARRQARKTKLA